MAAAILFVLFSFGMFTAKGRRQVVAVLLAGTVATTLVVPRPVRAQGSLVGAIHGVLNVINGVVDRALAREPAATAPEPGAGDIPPPLTGSSLSTIAVFLPFALLAGVAGAFFRPLAFTIAISLTISYLIAAFAVPAAVRVIERRKERRHSKSPIDRPSRFDRAVRFAVRRVWIPAAATALLFGAGFLLYRTIGTDFLPQMDEGSIILDYWTPPGTSLTDTNAMLDEIEQQMATEGVRMVELETATNNHPAIAFWKRHGYRPVAVHHRYYKNRIDAYRMIKEIASARAREA